MSLMHTLQGRPWLGPLTRSDAGKAWGKNKVVKSISEFHLYQLAWRLAPPAVNPVNPGSSLQGPGDRPIPPPTGHAGNRRAS